MNINVGNILLDGKKKVTIQSMANIKTSKVFEVSNQINNLKNAGCDIVRVSILDEDDAKAIKEIKKNTIAPIVADIHFDYRLAIKAIENGVDKIRINPGNIGSEDNIRKLCDCVKEYDIPVRVGSNSGSVEKKYLDKYGLCEKSLGESVLEKVFLLRKYGVNKIVVSAKSSDVNLMISAYKYIYNIEKEVKYHIGVTEAGTCDYGIIKNAIGIGTLLNQGIGDTIRVSLTADPIEEVYVAQKILKVLNLYGDYVNVVSCPTCGRTSYDLISLANDVTKKVEGVNKKLKIAVMGCVVNGPGEAKDADLGVAGGKDFCVFFKKGEVFKRVPVNNVKEEFLKEVDELINEH